MSSYAATASTPLPMETLDRVEQAKQVLSCQFNCSSGYTLAGTASICFGTTFTPQTCTPNPCPVSAPSNGLLGSCVASQPSGTPCSFTCNDGYSLNASSTNCSAGSAIAQTCTPNPCPLSVSSPIISLAYAPASISASDQLLLRTSVNQLDSGTLESELEYEWSTTAAGIILTDVAVLAGAANTPELRLKPNILTPGRCTFKVMVTDRNVQHCTATGGQPYGSAEMELLVTTAVTFEIDAQRIDSDPCAMYSPCKNGGTCVSTLEDGRFRLSCLCPTSPFRLFGPTCALGVLSCLQCVSAFQGGAKLTLLGLGFDSLLDVMLAGHRVRYTSPVWINATMNADVRNALTAFGQSGLTQLQAIRFSAPMTFNISAAYESMALAATVQPVIPPSHYEVLTLSALLPSTTASIELNYTTMVTQPTALGALCARKIARMNTTLTVVLSLYLLWCGGAPA